MKVCLKFKSKKSVFLWNLFIKHGKHFSLLNGNWQTQLKLLSVARTEYKFQWSRPQAIMLFRFLWHQLLSFPHYCSFSQSSWAPWRLLLLSTDIPHLAYSPLATFLHIQKFSSLKIHFFLNYEITVLLNMWKKQRGKSPKSSIFSLSGFYCMDIKQ